MKTIQFLFYHKFSIWDYYIIDSTLIDIDDIIKDNFFTVLDMELNTLFDE